MAHLNNDKEESLSEPLKKMSQDYKTVYKEMAECLLKGALAELGTITDKTNKIKYEDIKKKMTDKINSLAHNDPYLSRFIKSLQSKLVVEVFLNTNGDGLSDRGKLWKKDLYKVFSPETK